MPPFSWHSNTDSSSGQDETNRDLEDRLINYLLELFLNQQFNLIEIYQRLSMYKALCYMLERISRSLAVKACKIIYIKIYVKNNIYKNNLYKAEFIHSGGIYFTPVVC